ncbi:MAG: hypothetical protein KGL39_04940 [Patescibacteria group bacterium]|nr:hypothetical protein [Patescibacteria group bacterium]
MPLLSSGPLTGNVNRLGSNVIALNSGQAFVLGPEPGWYAINVNKYHTIQQFDPITGTWRSVGSSNEGSFVETVWSDGVNYRVVNQSGCVVGALLTNAGSNYTSAPLVTPTPAGSIWKAIVGGAVSTTVTVTNGGIGYTYPPIVTFSPPPQGGGIQATGYATLTSGVVSSITVVDQGAGYLSPPQITLTNDPREGLNNIASGYNAAAVASLTGAGTVTAVLMLDHGPGNQSAITTLAFSGGGGSSAAATAIMNWAITAWNPGTPGAGLAGTFANVTAIDNYPTTAPAYTNPTLYNSLFSTRPANIRAVVSGGALTLAGSTILDGGCYTSSPIYNVVPTASVVTTAPVVTFTLGGVVGASYIMPY